MTGLSKLKPSFHGTQGKMGRERERGLLITYHEVALILIDKTVSEQILLEVQTNGVGSTLEFKFPREIGEVTF